MAKECMYCMVDQVYDGASRYIPLAKFELGNLGYYELTLSYLEEEGEKPQLTLDLDECSYDDELLDEKVVHLKYCPFCGRKI